MNAYTDSHVHFDLFAEEGELEAILSRAADARVDRLVAIGGTAAANQFAADDLARTYHGRVHAAVGYDRDAATGPVDMKSLRELLVRPEIRAVGETGLDYHYGPDTAEAQRALFQAMLDEAFAHRLPVVVHSREAEADTLQMLRAQAARWGTNPLGVLHCFTGSEQFAHALIEIGMMISFSGILTYRNTETLRETARRIPVEHILIETDAPYLAPVPYRVKRNEPAYIVETAKILAKTRDCSLEQIADITSRNAKRLFGG